jgi:glycogen debranching enzyme
MRVLAAMLLAVSGLTSATASLEVTMNSEAMSRFVVVHGRRAWAGGYANGGLEVWAGALQIASNVQPEFLREGDVTPIPGPTILAGVSVAPSHFSRVYVGPDFAVEEDAWIPLDQPALMLRYAVHGAVPVQVVIRFHPSLNLMWPAAIGGQGIQWSAAQSGYVLNEPTKQFTALVLAPGATAHDEPMNDTRPTRSREFAIALDSHSPQILFAESSADVSVTSSALAAMLEQLSSSQWQEHLTKHYEDVLASGLQIETPDPDVNRALAWAQVDLDQDWFCNEQLGCGYVAGYGPSRSERRPQYAWYFAGDGMIALRAALAVGDLDRPRDELRFIAKYQNRETGMIWHELSQSAPYIDWRNKYPYMFVHADLTYPYISAVADYVRGSNDRDFLRELWPSVQRAFGYGQSLIVDGFPSIPKGKEGSDEQNSLKEELGLSANWIAACRDYAFLSELMGETRSAEAAKKLEVNARAAFGQRYWSAADDFAISGYRRDGTAVTEHGTGAVHAIKDRLFSDQQIQHLLDDFASWRFQSDWGVRGVATGEPGFNPTSYAHGSVSAPRTAEVAQAFWAEHRADTAFEMWRELVPWFSLDSLGHMHEVLRGDVYAPQSESVPEQTWSSAGFLSAAVHGLFGLEADSMSGTLALEPHLPANWDHVALRNVHIGRSNLTLTFSQSVDSLSVHIENTGDAVHLSYSPAIPLGGRNITATVNGQRLVPHIETHREDQHASLQVEVPHGACDITLHYSDGIEVIMPAREPLVGELSSAMKLSSIAFEKGALTLGIDVTEDQKNTLTILTMRAIKSASNASFKKLSNDIYELDIEPARTLKERAYHHEQVGVIFDGQ